MYRVTIKDIALNLGYSPSTVSRALSGDKSIRRETREKVLETANLMGYKRNALAATLRSGRSQAVGILVSELTSPFAAVVLEGIQQFFNQLGIKVIVASSGYDHERELQHLTMMENSMVDGIIVGLCHHDENVPEFRRLLERKFPLVFFAHTLPGLDAPSVTFNTYDKAFFLTDHIIRSGRRHITLILGPRCVGDMKDIRTGFVDAHTKYGLTVEPGQIITDSEFSLSEGGRIADSVIEAGMTTDCLISCNDLVAAGIIQRLRLRGVDVPSDIGVASFYGTPLGALVTPAITSVETSLIDMGHFTGQLLLDRIENPDATPQHIVMESHIRLRESTHANTIL